MDDAGEVHARDVAGIGVDALKCPSTPSAPREMIGQEAAAVLLGEDAGEAPVALRQRADVEDVDHQQVAGLRALDPDRAGQVVHLGEIDIAHVVGVVVVLDLAAGPVEALDAELIAGLDPGDHRDVRMPAVVDHVVLVGRLRRSTLISVFDAWRGSCPLSGAWFLVRWTSDRSDRQEAGDRRLRRHAARLSSWTIRPRSMTKMRSAMSSAKLSTCSQTTMVSFAHARGSRCSSSRDVLDDRRLDAFGRLVEQQHLRIGRQRARDGELLLLAAGEIAAAPSSHFRAAPGTARRSRRGISLLAGRDQAGVDVLLDRHGAGRSCGPAARRRVPWRRAGGAASAVMSVPSDDDLARA